ncbi:MAG: hypothetical protein AB8C95_12600 [Phycisphaeraceae bacterium]
MMIIKSSKTICWFLIFIVCIFVSEFVMATEVVGVVYERPLTEEERGRDHLEYLDYPMKGDKTLREYQDMYKKSEVPEDIIRVELVDSDPDDEFQELRLYSIKRGYDVIRMEAKWIKEHKDVLPLDVDPNIYRVTDTIVSPVDRTGVMYYPGMGEKDRVGFVKQEFEKIDGGHSWSMRLYDTAPHEINFHDMLRPIIHAPLYTQAQTPTGKIFSYVSPKDSDGLVAAAWMSGPHLAVYVVGVDIDLDEIVTVVGKKYPSSIKKLLEVNKTKWFREEVDMRLDQIAREIASETRDPQVWNFHLNYLMLNVSLPKLAGLQAMDDLSWEAREQINDQLKQWWHNTRDKTVWDQVKMKLVIEKDANRANEAEDEGLLPLIRPKPIKKREAEAAVIEIVRRFVKEKKDRAVSLTQAYGEHGDRVSWKQLGKGKWVLEHPTANGGPIARIHYSGPEITIDSENLAVPLIARFKVRMVDPDGLEPPVEDEVFYYHREDDSWRGQP